MKADLYLILAVAVIAAVTALIRFLPFLIFRDGTAIPGWVSYLGKVLPFSVMSMLVVYCLKDNSFLSGTHGLPELISCAVVAGLHIWKGNTLLSIICGTVCYMVLIQSVFI